jgi:hypothetical protein
MAFSFVDRGRRSLVDVRFTWIGVDRTSRCIRAPVALFATDVVQAATPFRSCNKSDT